MSSKLSIIVKNSTAEPLHFSSPVHYSIAEGGIASPPQTIPPNGTGAGGVFTFSTGLSAISVYESPDPKYVWILFVRAFSTDDIIAKTIFYPAEAAVNTVLVNDIQNSAAYEETATHVCTSVGVRVTFEATSNVNGELDDDLDDLDDLDDPDDDLDDLDDGPDEDLYVEFNLTAKATQLPYDEDSEEEYEDDDSVTSSAQESQSIQVFTGAAELTCHEFIRSIRERAMEAGKQRDDIWMADQASIRFGGEALKWFENLDEEVQADWKQLRRAIMARYDTPVYEGAPSSQSNRSKVAQPVDLVRCETCGEKMSAAGYKYCSPECSRKALSLEDTFSQLSVSSSSIGPQKRVIEGCNKAEWNPGSRYCGKRL